MSEFPHVSVIMPIRNEGTFIEHSLGAALSQDYPRDRYEVIVADGMSTDETRDRVRQFLAKHSNLFLIDNPGTIVSTGLNVALTRARGQVIVRLDGHTVIADDYLRQCVIALAESGADNVGGRMDAISEGFVGQAVAAATSSPFGVGTARFHYSDREEYVDTVYMGAWRRELFEKLGGFDEQQVRNQDDEFNYRLRDRGGKILLTPKVRSMYFNRTTLRSLWKQYFQYGFWKVPVMQKHPRQMRPRQFVPALFITTLAMSLLSMPFSPVGKWIFGLCICCYMTANIFFSVSSTPKRSWLTRAVMPLVFSTLHFSYGLGFLCGLVRFRNWRGESGRNCLESL